MAPTTCNTFQRPTLESTLPHDRQRCSEPPFCSIDCLDEKRGDRPSTALNPPLENEGAGASTQRSVFGAERALMTRPLVSSVMFPTVDTTRQRQLWTKCRTCFISLQDEPFVFALTFKRTSRCLTKAALSSDEHDEDLRRGGRRRDDSGVLFVLATANPSRRG